MSIRILSPELAARIAAGEVIERPASVVKELVENSLDAGARQITVEVQGGGLTLIQVSDDGSGIPPEDLPLAVQRHATSKIAESADLLRIATLGFRGEALASIAAAADLEIVSRPHDALVAGSLKVIDGAITQQGSRGAPPGTTVTVRHLFRRQPARLKFLRSRTAEHAHLTTIVSAYALAYPEVRFRLRLDGRTVLQTSGHGDLREAAAEVYSVDVAGEMLAVEDGPDTDAAIAVTGLISPPHRSRATRNEMYLFVNRRWIQSRSLTFAIEEAYQGLLTVGRHPIAVIALTLPVEDVDVNVHPAKAEVRFRDDRAVFAAVQRAVRRTLLASAPIPALSAVSVDRPATGEPRQAVSPSPPPTRLSTLQPLASTSQPQPTQPALAAKVPVLRPVGQVANTYIITEGPDGMYLIDQHAAHERVLFEHVRAARRRRAVEIQGLLEAMVVELSPAQATRLRDEEAALAEFGFGLEPFGDRTWLLRAVPAVLAGRDPAAGLREFLDLLERPDSPRDRDDRIAATIACHAAVRAGKILTPAEMRELVQLLEATEMPRTCPHGRPTMIHLSQAALEREFRRR